MKEPQLQLSTRYQVMLKLGKRSDNAAWASTKQFFSGGFQFSPVPSSAKFTGRKTATVAIPGGRESSSCRLSAVWKFEIFIISTFPCGLRRRSPPSEPYQFASTFYSVKGLSNSFRRATRTNRELSLFLLFIFSPFPLAFPAVSSEKFNFLFAWIARIDIPRTFQLTNPSFVNLWVNQEEWSRFSSPSSSFAEFLNKKQRELFIVIGVSLCKIWCKLFNFREIFCSHLIACIKGQ